MQDDIERGYELAEEIAKRHSDLLELSSDRVVARIDVFLTDLGQLWKESAPDMRLGQMLWGFNAWHTKTYHKDIFYLEEEELLTQLEEYLSMKHE